MLRNCRYCNEDRGPYVSSDVCDTCINKKIEEGTCPFCSKILDLCLCDLCVYCNDLCSKNDTACGDCHRSIGLDCLRCRSYGGCTCDRCDLCTSERKACCLCNRYCHRCGDPHKYCFCGKLCLLCDTYDCTHDEWSKFSSDIHHVLYYSQPDKCGIDWNSLRDELISKIDVNGDIQNLKNRVQVLEQELKYTPGNAGYQETEQHWNEILKN